MNVTFFKEHFMQTKSIAMAVLTACMACDAMALYAFENDWTIASEKRARSLCAETGECGSGAAETFGRDLAKFLASIGLAGGIVEVWEDLIR
jgi:hypothetical protein